MVRRIRRIKLCIENKLLGLCMIFFLPFINKMEYRFKKNILVSTVNTRIKKKV